MKPALRNANMNKILQDLAINANNSGAYDGAQWWSTHTEAGVIHAENPSTQTTIASINNCSLKDYQYLSQNSQKVAQDWRLVPAPKRGELIRQIAELLRAKKSALGSLVSLESGKSKVEGDGEVQEMIDMADFAVGQSRMLYGKTMHSERPAHQNV